LIGAGLLASSERIALAHESARPALRLSRSRQIRNPPHEGFRKDPRRINGGVHINSGIRITAFYLLPSPWAVGVGESGTNLVPRLATVQTGDEFRVGGSITVQTARGLYGQARGRKRRLLTAWKSVGIDL